MNTTTNQPTEGANTALSVMQEVEDFKAVISAAPDALTKNLDMVTKAVSQGDALRTRIEAGEMDDNMDSEINDHMVKLDKALEIANSRRTPFTRMMDTIKSRFTGIEKTFKDEKEAFQKVRDSYATKKRQEEAERQRLAALKVAQEKERIEVRSKIEQEIASGFAKKLSDVKEKMFVAFNNLTLDTFEDVSGKLKGWNPILDAEYVKTFPSMTGSTILSADEINGILSQVKSPELQASFAAEWSEVLIGVKTTLIDRLPGKKKELEDAKAKAEEAARAKAEAERLAAAAKSEAEKAAAEKARIESEKAAAAAEAQRVQQAVRDKEEAEARAKVEEEARVKAAAEAEAKKNADITNTLFNAEMENQMAAGSQAKGREGYEIIVNAPPGFLLIFNQWFQNEGKNLTVEQIAKKKLDSLVTFCEKFAHKNPKEKIESPFITYTEVFKTKVEKS